MELFRGRRVCVDVLCRFALVAVALVTGSTVAFAQFRDGHGGDGGSATGNHSLDPGVRGGPPGAGGPLSGMSTDYQNFFTAALARFQETDSVSGKITNENGTGLGPRFNATSCSGCHAFPAVGGSSPASNPQIAMAVADGATNKIPRFITANGPVREARFIRNPNGSPDGGVHDLFVITGRSDAPGCNITQPDFESAIEQGNIIFRIPTPLFGAGLVESITDTAIVTNAANPHKAALGISGQVNRSGNDGTVTRFGWKAQNKSLVMFAGEAYNVEQGVTNELFPNERDETPGCMFNALPEDSTVLNPNGSSVSTASDYSSDLVNFAAFGRLSAPPTPAPATATTLIGQQVFNQIGCNACHTPSINSGSTFYGTGLNNVPVNAFSDFLIHNMGIGLADQVGQGLANGMQFRTAPLWGVGQRIFFLHDGRTSDLVQAIEAHRSQGSEANQVINNFNQLSASHAAALLAFLRSL
ncbi:MAG TPA: di-heme oxidoredictase family protein [Candidatus Dormibacteraeota bacterium]|nr:di-heme oxidoredictase family protein [Candidatus Dormibacteraeota bacterium]